MRTRCGQVWTLSSTGSFFSRATSAICASIPKILKRWTRKAVAANAPEVHGHQDAGDHGNENAVQDVEAQQSVRTDLAAAEEKRARIVNRIGPDKIGEGAFVAEERRRPGHVRADGDGPDRQLIPREEITGKAQKQG